MCGTDDEFYDALRKEAAEQKAFYDELAGESPRAAVILAVASLEDELERLIRSKFPGETSRTLWKKIAGPGFTPLGSLSAKADIAQAFGFYGPKTRSIIQDIAVVRNKFAHNSAVRHFDHPSVFKSCKKLDRNPIFPDGTVSDISPPEHVRWVYVHTVQILEERMEAIRMYIPELGDPEPDPLL
jgi:hypothetical protein